MKKLENNYLSIKSPLAEIKCFQLERSKKQKIIKQKAESIKVYEAIFMKSVEDLNKILSAYNIEYNINNLPALDISYMHNGYAGYDSQYNVISISPLVTEMKEYHDHGELAIQAVLTHELFHSIGKRKLEIIDHKKGYLKGQGGFFVYEVSENRTIRRYDLFDEMVNDYFLQKLYKDLVIRLDRDYRLESRYPKFLKRLKELNKGNLKKTELEMIKAYIDGDLRFVEKFDPEIHSVILKYN